MKCIYAEPSYRRLAGQGRFHPFTHSAPFKGFLLPAEISQCPLPAHIDLDSSAHAHSQSPAPGPACLLELSQGQPSQALGLQGGGEVSILRNLEIRTKKQPCFHAMAGADR